MNRYIDDGDDVEKGDLKEKSYFSPLFKITLISRCHGFIVYLTTISFMQNSHKTLKANHRAYISS